MSRQRRFAGVRLNLETLESRLAPAAGYFRVATYNLASSGGNPRAGLETILQGIGNEPLPINATPPNQVIAQLDVIALQEVEMQSTTTQAVVNLMNAHYGPNVYSRGNNNGSSAGAGTVGVVYNRLTLQLLSESPVNISAYPDVPRQPMRYHFQPLGYPTAARFYLYVSHTKAEAADTQARANEAAAIRANADLLGNANIIYAGDFNTYTSSEPFFTTMFGAGAGQVFDPINRPGEWHNTASFRDIFTQAPALNPEGSLTGGGLDDRFDFQLVSGELMDGIGLDYVPNTYHTFGINGSIPYLNGNAEIDHSSNSALPTLPNRLDIFSKLKTVTDHLPVVADYKFYVPPTVTNVTINDGSPQRSRVTQLVVTFSEPVTFTGSTAAAFQLNRQSDNAPVTLAASPASGTASTVTITFTGGAFEFGSLADGRYNFFVIANNVQSGPRKLDGNGDMIGGDNYTLTSSLPPNAPTNIFRLYGDSMGVGTVGLSDYIVFRGAFGLGPSVAFDFDNDSNVDLNDYIQFRARFGFSV